MIKVGHWFIINALLKITQGGIITKINSWITHLPVVLLANRIIVKISTEITPF